MKPTFTFNAVSHMDGWDLNKKNIFLVGIPDIRTKNHFISLKFEKHLMKYSILNSIKQKRNYFPNDFNIKLGRHFEI